LARRNGTRRNPERTRPRSAALQRSDQSICSLSRVQVQPPNGLRLSCGAQCKVPQLDGLPSKTAPSASSACYAPAAAEHVTLWACAQNVDESADFPFRVLPVTGPISESPVGIKRAVQALVQLPPSINNVPSRVSPQPTY